MAEKNLIELLDQAVEATLTGRQSDALRDPSVATLLVLVADLRDLPDPKFKARLKAELIPQAQEENDMSTVAVRYPRPGFNAITPYLSGHGAADLIRFLEQAFDAKDVMRVARPDGTIMHAELQIGDSMIELGDATEASKARRFSLHLYVEDVDAVYARAIAAGAESLYEPVTQAYRDREAGVKDSFGNQWFIATHMEKSVGYRPKGFRTVTPGLRVHGTDRLIEFVKRAFDARELDRTTTPEGSIVHAVLRFGDAVVEAGEAHGQWEPVESALHFYVADVDAAYEQALRAGASSIMAPKDQPYGERGAAVADPFGNLWYLATVI